MIPSGAESFHGSFLGSEARSIAFDAIRFGIAITHLAGSEDALEEAMTEPFDGVPDAGNLGDVNANADDHEGILQELKRPAELLDAEESTGDQRVLLGKDCSQVEEDPAFLDAGNDGRIGATKEDAQFVRAVVGARQRQQMSGKDGRRGGAASDDGFTVDYFCFGL